MNASPATAICGLYNPSVSFWFLLFELLKVRMKFVEFLRQNISVRNKIILFATEFFLSLDKISTESIFPGYFVTHWKMINTLELVKSFVEERLATRTGPENIPFVRVSIIEVVCLK